MNTKTILIVGGVAVIGFIVYQMTMTHSSGAAPANAQNQNTSTAGNQTVATAGAAAASIIGALGGSDDSESGS